MRAFGEDIRERVLNALERGQTAAQVAKRYELSKRTVERWRTRCEKEGERTSRQIGGHLISRLAQHEEALREWIRTEPGLTLEQLTERLQEQREVGIGVARLGRFLNQIGLRFKKNAAGQRTRSP